MFMQLGRSSWQGIYLLIFLGILFMPLSIQAVLPPKFYEKQTESSVIKAIAVVTQVNVRSETKYYTSKEILFNVEKSFGDKSVQKFSASCRSFDTSWQESIDGGGIFFNPQEGDKVFVTVGEYGDITSYTRLSTELEKELEKNGLKNILYGSTIKIKGRSHHANSLISQNNYILERGKILAKGQARWKKGELEKALLTLERLVQINPANQKAAKVLKSMQLQKKKIDGLLRRATDFIDANNYKEAKRSLEKASMISSQYKKYQKVLQAFTYMKKKIDDQPSAMYDIGSVADGSMPKHSQVSISSSPKEGVRYIESSATAIDDSLMERSEFAMRDKAVMRQREFTVGAATVMIQPELATDEIVDLEYTDQYTRGLNKQVTIGSTSKSKKKHSQVFYEKGNHTIVDILYGTDRKIDDKKDWENYYTAKRGKLKYGVAQVSIPKIHEFGKMERPAKFWFLELKEKIGEHVIVTKLENIHKEDFNKFLKNKLNNVEDKDIFIFIHGFNVSFASAIRRTAQIAYDINFTGVPMAYSWPSQGNTREYMKDESSVQYTVPHLVRFLKEVINSKGEADIHILGHSMGTRALTNALKEISFIYPDKHLFKNIILAAPDIDKDVFEVSLFPYITKTTDQITLYASSDDSALKVSKTLHGEDRIGQSADNIYVLKGLDTIDATGIDTSLLGHSYFAEKEILVKDLNDVILESKPPSQRDSLIEIIKAKLAYWKFRLDDL